MSNNGKGKGNNNGPKSAEEHNRLRRDKKKVQRSRIGAGKGMHKQTLADSLAESKAILAENALAERLEKHLQNAYALAQASLAEVTASSRAKTFMKKVEGSSPVRTVVTQKVAGATIVVTKPAFPVETVEGMNALLDLFFQDNEENLALVEAHPVSARTRSIVQMHIVFGCEVFGLGDAFRKGHNWYDQIASGKTLRDQVNDYQRKLRAAELAARSKQQVA